MSSDATLGVESCTCKRKREKRERDANAGEAITDLPNHLVVEHILKSEYFDDPADLARLLAVSRAMRDAVAATGLRFRELDENHAATLGCLNVLKRLKRQGRLSRQEFLCQAAARSGQLEELKMLRATAVRGTRERVVGRRGAGISRCCNGRARTAAGGTMICAQGRQWAGISRCCNGRARTAAHGRQTRVVWRQRAGTSRCCSGLVRTDASGRQARVRWRQRVGTSRCYSGRARTVARGTLTPARSRRRTGTSRCCIGCVRTAARGTS
jgi:hypothetical protein